MVLIMSTLCKCSVWLSVIFQLQWRFPDIGGIMPPCSPLFTCLSMGACAVFLVFLPKFASLLLLAMKTLLRSEKLQLLCTCVESLNHPPFAACCSFLIAWSGMFNHLLKLPWLPQCATLKCWMKCMLDYWTALSMSILNVRLAVGWNVGYSVGLF